MFKLNGQQFKQMLVSGANNLENYQNEINALNVFPVPDGDTGTNMSMTFTNGCKEAQACFSDNFSDVAKALQKGLLMGARGNSGVITSQIFRGFYQSVKGKEEVTAYEIADAFENGAKVAYKAIMKPVEGTILTVIRESAWYAKHDFEKNPKISVEEYFDNLLSYARESLNKTPELLQQLKDAGVVDSGGAGLCRIFEGFKAYMDGKPVEEKCTLVQLTDEGASSAEDKYGYVVEIEMVLSEDYSQRFDEDLLKKKLTISNEQVYLKQVKDVITIKCLSMKPGDVLNTVQRYGELNEVEITNNNHRDLKTKDPKKFGIIAVASGEGLTKLFYDLGVDVVIAGGQTMNPSTQDFVDKLDELKHCEHIFIFPNNSNIILAAEQAKMISNQNVIVVPCKTIQQGVAAIGLFNPEGTVQENEEIFLEEIANVTAASLTYAVKDTSMFGVDVHKGDYLAICGKEIVASGADMHQTIQTLLEKMLKEKDGEIMTIITGEDADEKETAAINEFVAAKGIEVEIIKGDQAVYSYLFGLE